MVVTISAEISTDLAEKLEAITRVDGRSQDAVLKEALTRYLDYRQALDVVNRPSPVAADEDDEEFYGFGGGVG